MKVLVFLVLLVSQFTIVSHANDNSGHEGVCSTSEQVMNMANTNYKHNHFCDNCAGVSIALPTETMRYFVLINQALIGLKLDYLYLSKISEVENPPPIFL